MFYHTRCPQLHLIDSWQIQMHRPQRAHPEPLRHLRAHFVATIPDRGANRGAQILRLRTPFCSQRVHGSGAIPPAVPRQPA